MISLNKSLSRAVKALQKATVEPFVFLMMLNFFTTTVVIQSLFDDRACRILLNYTHDVCNDLENVTNHIEQQQSIIYGNNFFNAYQIIVKVPAVGILIFAGPWSDKYSRKCPLLIASLGTTLDWVIEPIITAFPDASPYWFLASAAITGCTGGVAVIISFSFSYLSDITDERSRQTRFAILQFFLMVSIPIGYFVGGQVFKAGGYLPVMILRSCISGLGCMWLIFFVPETKTNNQVVTKGEMLKEIFQLDSLKECYKTCVKPRPENMRKQIWLLVFTNWSFFWILDGTMATDFQYVRKVYKWTVPRYTLATTVFSLYSAFLVVMVVPFLNKRLKMREAAIGLVGVLSLIAKMLLMSVIYHEYFVYGAMFAGSLGEFWIVAIKSRISKLVSKGELGQIFALLGIFEAVTPALGTLFMVQLYNLTISFYPGLVYISAAIFMLPSAAIFVWMLSISCKPLDERQESHVGNKNAKTDISA